MRHSLDRGGADRDHRVAVEPPADRHDLDRPVALERDRDRRAVRHDRRGQVERQVRDEVVLTRRFRFPTWVNGNADGWLIETTALAIFPAPPLGLSIDGEPEP